MPQTDCKPVADGSYQSRDLEEEFLIYDSNGDQVHVLNGTARAIFLLCDGTRRPVEIAEVIVKRFEVEPEQALADVNETLDQLVEIGLLRI